MARRKGSYPILLTIMAALLAGGCSGRLVHKEVLDATGRIAVVSVVMPRIADTGHEANRKVLQAAVDHAAVQVRSGLAGTRPWTVLDAATIGGGKAALSFGKISQKDIAVELTSWRERFIGASGLPVIPRESLASDEERTQKDPAVRAAMLQQAGALCQDLNVDAVVFAHLRCTVTHPRENAFIVTDERTDGLLALSATLVVVDKTGRIIVDMGLRPIDKRSPSRDLLPLYRGAGKDAVTEANIDLADPKKKVQRAFTLLTDEAVAELMARMREDLQE